MFSNGFLLWRRGGGGERTVNGGKCCICSGQWHFDWWWPCPVPIGPSLVLLKRASFSIHYISLPAGRFGQKRQKKRHPNGGQLKSSRAADDSRRIKPTAEFCTSKPYFCLFLFPFSSPDLALVFLLKILFFPFPLNRGKNSCFPFISIPLSHLRKNNCERAHTHSQTDKKAAAPTITPWICDVSCLIAAPAPSWPARAGQWQDKKAGKKPLSRHSHAVFLFVLFCPTSDRAGRWPLWYTHTHTHTRHPVAQLCIANNACG